jgi:7-cyano-7-deazaguanine synthase
VGRVAVLASGGVDSAILLADLATANSVFPVYVEFGLRWETTEKAALEAYLARLSHPNVAPLTVLQLPVQGIYGRHWSTTGEGVPEYGAPDETVYLPGRNVLLIGLTAVWCALNGIEKIAIGSLEHNPFPDATPAFFADYGRLLSGALSHEVEVIAPFRGREKADIVREHAHLPLELTLTCMNPRAGLHCGECNKCRERHEAFVDAGIEDETRYATPLRR